MAMTPDEIMRLKEQRLKVQMPWKQEPDPAQVEARGAQRARDIPKSVLDAALEREAAARGITADDLTPQAVDNIAARIPEPSKPEVKKPTVSTAKAGTKSRHKK